MLVEIETGSRIHLGFIDLSGDLGRLYGSIGIYLREPGFRAVVGEHEGIEVEGDEVVRDLAERVVEALGLKGIWLKVLSTIPLHVGLGSTTQTVLGIAAAALKLYGIEVEFEELVYRLGRGRRSGVGAWLFRYGGLVVDGGRDGGKIPPLITRIEVPEDLKIVLALPKDLAERGLSEREEEEVFSGLGGSPRLAERASRIVLMKLLPSLIERNYRGFGGAVTQLDRINGQIFERIQSGVYRRRSEAAVEAMLRAGAVGVGQSSWGPVIYGFIHGEGVLDRVVGELKDFRVIVTEARNVGAEIRPYSAGIT